MEKPENVSVDGMIKYPLVSIITVSYNSQKTIGKTIRSVLDQSYPSIEYILVDGSSKDDTVSVISSFESMFRQKAYAYKWICEPDNGIYDAFNKGLSLATGEYIGFLNSDDWYEPNGIENIINERRAFPAIYSGHMNLYIENDRPSVKIFRSRPERLFQTMRIAHPATLVSHAIFNEIGNFSTKYKIAGDYDFFLRAKLNGYKIIVVYKVISNMRLGGISRNLPLVLKEELKIKNIHLGKKMIHYAWYLASLTIYLVKVKLLLYKENSNAKTD
jgi:glycosyltransferase involved in cell wall biosynthesis